MGAVSAAPTEAPQALSDDPTASPLGDSGTPAATGTLGAALE